MPNEVKMLTKGRNFRQLAEPTCCLRISRAITLSVLRTDRPLLAGDAGGALSLL